MLGRFMAGERLVLLLLLLLLLLAPPFPGVEAIGRPRREALSAALGECAVREAAGVR